MQKVIQALGINADIWHKALNSGERIERIKTPTGDVYWLKKSAPARGVFRYYALNFFSKLLKVPLLKAVPQKGDQIALDIEAKRIATLQKNGVLVPKLIAKNPGWILLGNLGESIIDDFKQNQHNTPRVQKLFADCLDAIKQLHEKGQYMSQGFARNMLKVSTNPVKIGFIDFEDDPLTVMSLAQAQARDLILFINSTARFFIQDLEFLQQQIHTFLDGHDPKVINNIKKTNKNLLWLTNLPLQKILGHDYQKFRTGILALKNIVPKSRYRNAN
ncbi:MAG: hypothetical protein L3J53_05555 [Proteobacteria bacterium]|nr:hypothetical protein [Pseudomonadota bacterium]